MSARQEVQGFDLIRWARKCAYGEFELRKPRGEFRRLTSREAHLLLLLSTYAGRDCKCFPSIKTLADDMRLKATLVERERSREDPQTIAYYRCSAVSAALDGLQDLGLIWSESGGRGRKAVRELLYDPAALEAALARAGLSSVTTDPKNGLSSVSPVLSSVSTEENYQENCSDQLPNSRPNGHMLSSADAEDNHAPRDGGQDRRAVREAVRRALDIEEEAA